jgi:TolB protein
LFLRLPSFALLVMACLPGALHAKPPVPLGQLDSSSDVGAPKLRGSSTYDATTQEYTLTGAGVNMWGTRDEFQFAWKKMSGDFILQTHVAFVGQGKDPHRKAGLIVRPGFEADSPYADVALHGDGLTSLQYRKTPGAETLQVESTVKGPDVLQLERKGNTYTMSVARFGEPFTVSEVKDLALGDAVYVGLFVCSHDPAVVEKAVFRNVRIIRPVKEGYVPYRDFIGSHLELLDVASGRRELVYSSKDPFEAPNWTPDGKALIYNTSGRGPGRGRLVRFDLATREPALIDTGFANRNNNDHVLSFDGKMLGISDQSTDKGQSTIFTLPAAGGTPRRVTPLVPSYLHGWSPDGKWLVYTGGRNDEYDIYRIPSDGSGPEVKLTSEKALDDGPEYSPDGKYIYFNSARSGRMQLWRMKPDGADPERVLTSESHDWFPHVSPDGQWIAFLSFGDDVDASDHPYYKRVYLRVMPVAGGPAKVIAYVYGGQGTVNVPSWSPDSKRLAFVSNSAME